MDDDELDAIRVRDAKRQTCVTPGLANAKHPAFDTLHQALRKVLATEGINQGNVYADWLADKLLSLPGFKVRLLAAGDRIEYVGPGPTIYAGPRDHPSYYTDYQIVEVKSDNDWLHPHSLFARVWCKERERGTPCASWQHLEYAHWRVLP